MYKFIGHDNWRNRVPYPHLLDEMMEFGENLNKEVVVLRGCLFFYETQITTLREVKEHFTQSAVNKLFHDGFLKFKD